MTIRNVIIQVLASVILWANYVPTVLADLCCGGVCASKTEYFKNLVNGYEKYCGNSIEGLQLKAIDNCEYPKISYGTCSDYIACLCDAPGLNLNFGIVGIVLIGGLLSLLFLYCHLMIVDSIGKTSWRLGVNLMFYTIIPVLDTISNLLVLTNSDWTNINLFVLAWLTYFAPSIIFLYQIYRDGMKGIPMYCYYPLGIPDQFIFERYDSCSKILITFFGALPYCLVFWVRHLFLIPHFLWFLLGYFLFLTKVMCIGRVQRFWFEIWAGKTDTVHNHIIDQRQLNEQYFTILTLQASPWLILQCVNAKLLGFASPIQIVSLVISGLMIIAGLYRYAFHLLYDNIPIGEVPIPMAVFFDLGDDYRAEDNKDAGETVVSPFSVEAEKGKIESDAVETSEQNMRIELMEKINLLEEKYEKRFEKIEEELRLLKA